MSLEAPCFCTRQTQSCIYRLQDMHPAIKGILITTLALACIALIVTSLLNHYHIAFALNTTTQWSLLALGICLGSALLIGLITSACTKSYKRNPYIKLDPDYHFLSTRPEWRASEVVLGRSENLRANTQYHDWYEFTHTREFHRLPGEDLTHKVRMKDDPSIEVHWHEDRQTVYRRDKKGLTELHRVTFEQMPRQRYFYPYLRDGHLFIGTPSEVIALNLEEKVSQSVWDLPNKEQLSLIRFCGDILILGYRSGLVQLINYESRKIVASFSAGGEVLDTWIDFQKKEIVTFSHLSYTWAEDRRRYKQVWKFKEENAPMLYQSDAWRKII